MKSFLLAGSSLLTVLAWASPLKFAIAPDHADHLYKVGETAAFTVTVTAGGKAAESGKIEATLDNFGPKVVSAAEWDLADTNCFRISGKLDEPGFLRLSLKELGDGKGKPQIWSVGYEPEKIVKGSPSPEDFDTFWATARSKLAKEVPLDAQMTKVPERTTKDFDYYRISFATFGRRVHGFMSVPTDRSKAPFPVEMQVSAAGFGGWTNAMNGEKDRIRVFFSVYPFEPDWRWKELKLEEKYKAMNDECEKKYGNGYRVAGIAVSREECFFYPVLLGLDRAVDWLAAREDIDPKRFWYQGTSQGGGLGFALTGLNHRFTRAAFFVPAITDVMGYRQGRNSGWPLFVESYDDPEGRANGRKAAAERNAPYFDAANFASRIQCPVRVAVGFSDSTCPAPAVYATYNELKVADKAILHGFGMTHSCFGRFYDQLLGWLHGKVKRLKG